jgi:hypothetical protein
MKVNAYAVLPAEVRYDKTLRAESKLLYTEISACSNFDGICEEDLNYFAGFLNCDVRSIYRYLAELVDGGHIMRERMKGIGRVIRIPVGFAKQSLSRVNEVPDLTNEMHEEDLNFFDEFLNKYETTIDVKLDKKKLYYPTLKDRLKTFSRNELMEALENRANFINGSDWHQQNKHIAGDLSLLIKDDDAVHKALNMKVERKDNVVLKPLKF